MGGGVLINTLAGPSWRSSQFVSFVRCAFEGTHQKREVRWRERGVPGEVVLELLQGAGLELLEGEVQVQGS